MNTNSIIKEINNYCDEYIVVGVSSGPDSMALLHILQNNTSKKIVCAHINHNIRKESKEEEEFLKSINEIRVKNNLPELIVDDAIQNVARLKAQALI